MLRLVLLVILAAACKPADPPVTTPAPRPAEPTLHRAFTAGPFTKPLPKPQPGDWLAIHREKGQTFEQFQASNPNVPRKERRTIYLQPIGQFAGPRSLELELLREFTAVFFELPVVVRSPMSADEFPSREHAVFGRQLHSTEALDILIPLVPDDAYCMLAVTLEDLYPGDDWNFVFGQASLAERAGIFSFARYSVPGTELTSTDRRLLTLRAFKVLAHETGHMFGIRHCTAYLCGMNGSNNLEETDRAPLPFCPVCLRKLQSSIGFDVAARDLRLAAVFERAGLENQAKWYRDRNEWLLAPE